MTKTIDWDRIADDRKAYILNAIITEKRRVEWHKNKFKTPGWRVGFALVLPAVFAVRWLVYAPDIQKLWAIAIFLGGTFFKHSDFL